MNVGSIRQQADAASTTIASARRAKRTGGSPFEPRTGVPAAPRFGPFSTLPASAMPILIANAGGAPAAPAAPPTAALSLAARMNVTSA